MENNLERRRHAQILEECLIAFYKIYEDKFKKQEKMNPAFKLVAKDERMELYVAPLDFSFVKYLDYFTLNVESAMKLPDEPFTLKQLNDVLIVLKNVDISDLKLPEDETASVVLKKASVIRLVERLIKS